MKQPSLPPILGLSLLAVLIATAGTAQHGSSSGPPLDQLYPGALGMADFGKVVSGEFTGDLKRDAVVMDGFQPTLQVAPETFDTAISVGGAANDLAVYPGFAGGPERILTVGGLGLQRHARDPDDQSWIVETLANAQSPWANALLVATGNLDGTGADDIVGVAANGRDVLTRLGASGGTLSAGPTFQANGTSVYGLHLLNWRNLGDTSGPDEIALLTSWGVEIYEDDGTYLEGIAWSSPIVGTVIQDQGQTRERLAMVSKISGVDYLYVYGDVKSEGPHSLGAPGVVSMTSGDADGDGDSEVFLGVTTERKFWMLESLSPATITFDAASPDKFAYGPAGRDPAINHAGLTTGDFDNDGDLDVLAPAQGDLTGTITVYGTVAIVDVGGIDPAVYQVGLSEVVYDVEEHELRFRLTAPATTLTAPSGAQTKLGVKVWRTPDFGVATIPETYDETFLTMPTTDVVYAMPLPSGYDPETSLDLFTLVIRQTVIETATGYVLDISPATTMMYAPEPNWDTVKDSTDTNEWSDAVRWPESTPTGSGGTSTGPTVPRPEDEEEPADPDPRG